MKTQSKTLGIKDKYGYVHLPEVGKHEKGLM